MRALIQRVASATVDVDGHTVGSIGPGMLIFVGVGQGDSEEQSAWMADKISGLRIFADEDGKMNRSILDQRLGALVVSQFTLFGDCRKGRRPSFVEAAAPKLAERLYERFCGDLERQGIAPVERGVFRAHMRVSLVNDGPVTLMIDTP